MTNSVITLQRVSFVLPDGNPLFSELTAQFGPQHTGLIGRNGVGKSILAKMLAGLVAPASGRVLHSGRVRYLAQHLSPQHYLDVATLAGVQPQLAALGRIEAGGVDPADFDLVGDGWDLRQRLQTLLTAAGLGALTPESAVSRLSGGEAMRVALAGALVSQAGFLILDEPTNHLDLASLQVLEAFLCGYPGTLVVASHDEVFLRQIQLTHRLLAGKAGWECLQRV